MNIKNTIKDWWDWHYPTIMAIGILILSIIIEWVIIVIVKYEHGTKVFALSLNNKIVDIYLIIKENLITTIILTLSVIILFIIYKKYIHKTYKRMVLKQPYEIIDQLKEYKTIYKILKDEIDERVVSSKTKKYKYKVIEDPQTQTLICNIIYNYYENSKRTWKILFSEKSIKFTVYNNKDIPISSYTFNKKNGIQERVKENFMPVFEILNGDPSLNLNEVDWYNISRRDDLSEEFITKYQNRLNWGYIFENNQNLSKEFKEKFIENLIEKHKGKIDWNYIYGNNLPLSQKSEQLIEKYKNNVNWEKISHLPLSENFLYKFQDKIYFIIKNYDIYNNYYYEIPKFQKTSKLSEKFIEIFKDKLDWVNISSYQTLSEEFIEKYQDNVDWESISVNQTLSEEFIERYMDNVNWKYISAYQKLSEPFIEKHKDKLYMRLILKHQNLSEEFRKKHGI